MIKREKGHRPCTGKNEGDEEKKDRNNTYAGEEKGKEMTGRRRMMRRKQR